MLIAGALAVAGLVAGAAVAVSRMEGSDQAGNTAPATSAPATATRATEHPHPSPDSIQQPIPTPARKTPATAAQACAAEVTTAEAVVNATRIGAGHWREHVRARTDLLAGKLSQAATKAIWKRTRLAGPADLTRLAAATAAHQPTRGACAKIAGAAGTACRHRMTVLDAAATAGRAAVHDWQAHLQMMAAHKIGDMTDARAQDMWVTQWRAAPKNLNAFARAYAVLTRTGVCHPA